MTTLLFIATSHPSFARLAEAWVLERCSDELRLLPGFPGGPACAAAEEVMRETGLASLPEPGTAIMSSEADLVIALDSLSPKLRRNLSGCPEIVEWGLDLPLPPDDTQPSTLAAWREISDQLRNRVGELLDHGYLNALKDARCCAGAMLDTISDGILAHTPDRRIFFFNKAAETITGYSREEVIDKDCHDVFPGKLCGGKCLFCDDLSRPSPDIVRRMVKLNTKSGEARDVAMTIKPLPAPVHGSVLVSLRDLTREQYLARRAGEIRPFAGIVSRDKAMRDVFDMIEAVADSPVPVLIQGESGTGKELVAAAIHNESVRADKLFVAVNCGALPEALLESELFGHVKGAFTGAVRDKKGRFELADGGTIFLDEIGDISLPVQVKLLRVLQEGCFERVGGETSLRTTARIVSATNKDLTREIAEGRFREDLYYRLNVVPILLPPLRERRQDILLLADHILKQAAGESLRDPPPAFSAAAIEVLQAHDWPGNVRELQNWIQYALVKARGSAILPEHFPPVYSMRSRSSETDKMPLGRRRKPLTVEAVRDALQRAQGKKVEAARQLGISRATLYRFLDKAGLME